MSKHTSNARDLEEPPIAIDERQRSGFDLEHVRVAGPLASGKHEPIDGLDLYLE